MTHELILTSVERGLNRDHHGFCPVALDAGISPKNTEFLCTLSSSWRVVPRLGKKGLPAYSHLILPNIVEHVLSCVSDAGMDYKKQPNVLLHHIILDEQEFIPEGPAWLLGLPDFHLSEWKGSPLLFLQGRPIPTLTHPPSLARRQQIARQTRWLHPQKMALTGYTDTASEHFHDLARKNDEQITLAATPSSPCPTWHGVTGDAGWGGILAETAFTSQPVVLIYKPEWNILPLYIEALFLLPSSLAWQVTFCTHYTGLPDTMPCQWKGVIAGSKEEKRLTRDTDNLIIDLTKPIGESPDGIYVAFARLGQEHSLPTDSENEISALADADTKPFDDFPSMKKGTIEVQMAQEPLSMTIQPQKKQAGLLSMFLHRSSRFQFYFLYSIMLVLVLFLLVLAVDQTGDFGLIRKLRYGTPPMNTSSSDSLQIDAAADDLADDSTGDPVKNVPFEQESSSPQLPDPQALWAAKREEQKELLIPVWESFAFPESLGIPFPAVQENQIDLPEKKTFEALSSLYPFGAALDIQFIPLFDPSQTTIRTLLKYEAFPLLIWQVEAVDSSPKNSSVAIPLFQFQLTESGLEMSWQPEGLSNQYLYETILSSLGFLQINAADLPVSAKIIPLFDPLKTEPINVSEWAALAESTPSEYAIASPFVSELWQRIFANQNPPKNLIMEVRAEPAGNWAQITETSSALCQVTIPTSQQVRKQAEGIGGTVVETFETIKIPLVAEASLENILWKGGAFAEQLKIEKETLDTQKKELNTKIDQLQLEILRGKVPTDIRKEQEIHKAALKNCDSRLGEIDRILEKLPDAYREIQDQAKDQTRQFHYHVFIESSENKRRLLVLTSEP